MNRKIRAALIVLLAVVFVGSLVMFLRQIIQYREAAETYDEAKTLAELPDLSQIPLPEAEPETPPAVEEAPADELPADEEPEKPVYVDPYADALRNMDFEALREVNSDVLGWIVIPGTAISYPLVQGEDNQYYLKHTWKKWTSAVGAIFLECRKVKKPGLRYRQSERRIDSTG